MPITFGDRSQPARANSDAAANKACAELLGWHIIDARPDEGWIFVGFEGRPEFRNPAGFIQGGFLAAMLDDTLGPTIFLKSWGKLYTVTTNMNVSFLNPARVGPIFGEGQILQAGKTLGFVEAKLTDKDGLVLARATATVRIVAAEKALG